MIKVVLFIYSLTFCLSCLCQTIKVYPDSIKNSIPLFGYNFTYASNGNHLLNDDTTWNEERRQAVVDLNPGWLRFPGGTICNLYKWKNAIGSKSGRIGMNGNTYVPETNFYGPDEAGLLAEDADAQLVIPVSTNWGAQYAADWVEYMNSEVGVNANGGIDYAQMRADNGHYEPYGVKYWEIGNEAGNHRIWQKWKEEYDPMDYNTNTYSYNNGTTQFRDWVKYGGDKSFYGYRGVTQTSWKNSYIILTGAPNEKRYTKLAPVVSDSIVVRVGLSNDNSITWTRVNDLTSSGPTDLHYTFDALTGEILFGDDINGAIPDSGNYVFTDFAIQDYDGYLDIYQAMKEVDSTIEIGSAFWFLQFSNPEVVDANTMHGDYDAPTFYPNDEFNTSITRAIGEYTYKYLDAYDHQTSPPLFVTEIGTYSRTMEGAMFYLMLYSKIAQWGKEIKMIGPNYLLGTSQVNQCHIDHSWMGSNIQPIGYVTTLFNSHFGKKHVLATSHDIPFRSMSYYKSINDQTLYTKDVDKIYSVSSLSEDGKRLYVLCVNNTKQDTIPASIEILTDSLIFELDTAVILRAESITDYNSSSDPYKVNIKPILEPVTYVGGVIENHAFQPASATVFEFTLVEDEEEEGVGLENLENQSKLNVFPNPTEGVITVRFNGINTNNLRVLNLLGQDVTESAVFKHVNENEVLVDLRHLTSGSYVIQLGGLSKVINKL
ncbi:MAG: T9SS type A sorting domain-containing protein [Lishizhenia sp.]